MDELKSVSINEKEQIFLNDEEIKNVVAYKLENSTGGTAELTVTIYVNVAQVAAESKSQ